MKLKFQIFILLFATVVFSQEQEVAPPYNIKTVTFSQNVNNTIPFFRLGESFNLQFDDLFGNEEDYYYTIEHYNYDWTPSQLLKNEYISGLDNQRIQDYQNSLNCLQVYSHYKLSFPNRFNQIIKSGNYIVKVYDDEQNIIFSRKFIIYEDLTSIGVTIRRSRDMETIKHKQNIEFFIDYKDKPLQNPKENFKVSIYQNGKFSNAIHNIKPQYTIGTQLIYRYNKETQFWAGNEFLNFENKNIRAASNAIAKVTTGDIYNTILYTNEPRKNKIYTYFPDINGNFFVTNFNTTNNEIEADYAWVYFGLAADENSLNKSVYISGMFNNYQISDEFKMEYNASTKTFEKAVLIKQGFTNYQYTLVDANGKIDEENAIDGNFYQTENEYIVLVYYKGPAERYDRVVGIARQNSTEIKN
ncbi:type IX secretion system plug protein [Flavobacterium urocaniciphilum]|uniref:Type 9 secretion system plug protein N-terminal domain-containing protein n=1 Tax=Flavobacterium urocaniciphilum TaxID=1299341 RepID=A0A1H9AKW8_9FLAO|nr:DUF5103 domain-containing protein [Flavobacterium urocaniciphilum]SEP77299.1 protein of unknown function [Flavobacterium urocaniciphilum]